LDLGGVTVQVLWTPGHSSHHQSFFVPEDEVLIVGDAGGFHDPRTGVIMPTTPPPFNPPTAVESLDRLIALEPRRICYGHFGFACDAVEKLEVHRRQVLLWSRLVEEGMEEGLSLRNIYARIRAEDPMAMQAGEFKEDRRERSSLINLIGFVKYFEWIKEKEGKT
jgi:glyoxylase-like metal-dependent hydrolase (beta-lactamase superfamily II)